jgi:hypothetical protein
MLENSGRITPSTLIRPAYPHLFICRCPKCGNNGFTSPDGHLLHHHCCGLVHEQPEPLDPPEDPTSLIAWINDHSRGRRGPKGKTPYHVLFPTGACHVCGAQINASRTNGRPTQLFCEASTGAPGVKRAVRVQSRCQRIAQRWHAFMKSAVEPVPLPEYARRFDAEGNKIRDWREKVGW